MDTLRPWERREKPTGSAASWGMVKLSMSMSPTTKLEPAWKSSRMGWNSPQGMAGAVRRLQ